MWKQTLWVSDVWNCPENVLKLFSIFPDLFRTVSTFWYFFQAFVQGSGQCFFPQKVLKLFFSCKVADIFVLKLSRKCLENTPRQKVDKFDIFRTSAMSWKGPEKVPNAVFRRSLQDILKMSCVFFEFEHKFQHCEPFPCLHTCPSAHPSKKKWPIALIAWVYNAILTIEWNTVCFIACTKQKWWLS